MNKLFTKNYERKNQKNAIINKQIMIVRNKKDNILREIDGFQNEQQNITNQINIMKEKCPLIMSNLDIKNNNNSNNNPNTNNNINNIMNNYNSNNTNTTNN